MKRERILFALALSAALCGCPMVLGVDGDYVLGEGETTGTDALPGDESRGEGAVVEADGATDVAASDGALTEDAASDAPAADAPPVDAPVDVATDRGGDVQVDAPPSSVGVVECGGNPCSISSLHCCTTPLSATCISSANACGGATKTRDFACDEPADCPANQVCCVETMTGERIRAECRQPGNCDVNFDGFACRSGADCNSGVCTTWPCALGPPVSTCDGKAYESKYCY